VDHVLPGRLMAAEMAAQPSVLAALDHRRSLLIERVRAVLPSPHIGTVLVARGSSDNAAVFGRYVLELAGRRPVALAAPSLHTLYGARTRAGGYLAVAVSQSGRTPEIVTTLRRLRRAGAVAVAITNEPDSQLGAAADAVVDLGAGAEEAVPATKTFTAQVAAFAILAEALGPVPWSHEDWAALPSAVSAVLDDPTPAQTAAAALEGAPGVIAVGRGLWYGTALEAALKLRETTGMLAEGYSAADLRHGPIAVVEQAFPVLAFCPPGPTAADMAELVALLRQRGAHVLTVSQAADAALGLPGGLAEAMLAIPASVRAQQVALAASRARGLDPDAPAGLTKVTATH